MMHLGDELTGESLTQPLQPGDEQRIRTFLLEYPGVTAIREVLVTFLGPFRLWIIARVDIDDELRGVGSKA
jgi:hypothetical protein